jgi:hypothetical protein
MQNKKEAALVAAKKESLAIEEMTTVYTEVHSVARSGMSRKMSAFILRKEKFYCIDDLIVAMDCAGAKWANKGFKVNGCGMDMGYAVVIDLSRALHGDYKKLQHEWL